MLGIIRYEMLMAWRRGSTRMILFVMLALPIATYLYTSDSMFEGIECMCEPDGTPYPPQVATMIQTYTVLGAAIFIIPVLMLIVPVMIADTIPLDRHYGVSHILNSLPISAGEYLLGKVGAAVSTVIGATGIGLALWGVLVAFRQFTPEILPMLIFWISTFVLAVISAVLGVLVPAVSPNRRKAVAWGFAAAFGVSVFSTLLPVYKVSQKALERLGEITYPVPDPFPDITTQYPDPFDTGALINYGIILFVIAVIVGIVLRRMQTSEAPI